MRRALLDVRGTVVDLGGPLAAVDSYPAEVVADLTVLSGTGTDLVSGLAAAAPVDTVVSVARLALLADPAPVVAAVRDALAPGGRLVVVEPDPGPGVLTAGVSRVWALSGMTVTPEIARHLRAAGLSVLRVRRFSVPTPAVPLRNWVWATARPARHEEER